MTTVVVNVIALPPDELTASPTTEDVVNATLDGGEAVEFEEDCPS